MQFAEIMYCIFDAQRTILERDRQFFVCVCLFFSEIELGNVDKRELWVPFLNNHENFYKNISINSFRVVRLMTLSKEVARFEIGSNVNFRSCLRINFLLEILKASKFCSALSLKSSRHFSCLRRNKRTSDSEPFVLRWYA